MHIQGEIIWHCRCKTQQMYNTHWLSFKYLKFIHIHVFIKKVRICYSIGTYTLKGQKLWQILYRANWYNKFKNKVFPINVVKAYKGRRGIVPLLPQDWMDVSSGVPRNFVQGGFSKFSWQRTERMGIWGR
jgi:hypothetical protein